jgi:cysteine synthase B
MNDLKTKKQSQESLQQQIEELGRFIGNTPLFPITHLNNNKHVQVFAKMEWQQFSGSVKARPGYRIIKDAIENGELTKEKQLIDASSGNTGIAYAHIGALLGISVTLYMPENVSQERKRRLKALGVELHFTSASGGIDESQELVKELSQKDPNTYFYANQYDNESNWKAHYDTTGPEIWRQTEGKITHFIAGLGTSGTFTGTGRRLKEFNPDVRLISVQPDENTMNDLEGWKNMDRARVPRIYDDKLADENRFISMDQSHKVVQQAAKQEGLLLSPSAGADLASALQLAQELDEGIVVTVFPDDSSKYSEEMDVIWAA